MQPGDLIDLDVTGVAHGGVFVGRHEGRVVFVPDALPGERVRVRLTQTGERSFWRGETLEVLDASPHRRPHVWRQADVDVPPEGRPGGADLGHAHLSYQRELKHQVLADALLRIGGLDVPSSLDALPSDADDEGLHWRTRVSLHVDEDGLVGPFAARSHRVIPVDDLPLATPAVERAAKGLRASAPGRIDLVQPADGRVRILPRPEKRPRRPEPGRDPGREVVVERVGDREFVVDVGGFWQVHRRAAVTLADRVAAALRDRGVDPDAAHLDLYGGVGLLGAALAGVAGPSARLTSVESDPRATEHAGENLAEWVGARAETGRVDRWLAGLLGRASAAERERLRRGAVILDPPRAGAGREVVEAIAELGPAQVVYVACDPVALARDLKTFREAGYSAPSVAGIDLFPNSHHLEAVASLTREDPAR